MPGQYFIEMGGVISAMKYAHGCQEGQICRYDFPSLFYSVTLHQELIWRTPLVQASIVSETGYPTVSYTADTERGT
jgi:hypothetical protein